MLPDASNRRRFLKLTAGAAALTGCKKEEASDAGATMRPYGGRASSEKSERYVREGSKSPGAGSSRTPLQDLYGIITPSALHFERHHSGVPAIDPDKHTLLVHGLVERPLVFTMADIRRFPSVSRIHFVECSGNTAGDLANDPPPDAQRSHGMLSCSEWTGCPLSLLLREAGLKPEAKWMIAEGGDSGRMARSIPIEKALDDAFVAYGQNGEALRPEQGYPLRLILPGWEGNTNIKWLRRLNLADQPAMSVKETAQYTDLMPDGSANIFTFVMDVRSVITRPSGGQKIAPGAGFQEIVGIAWTGSGRVKRVEVSTDDGKSWNDAELQDPVLPKAVTRFRYGWQWDGQETFLHSRCTDEAGFTQPTRDAFLELRGARTLYHYNGIKRWHVRTDGTVTSV